MSNNNTVKITIDGNDAGFESDKQDTLLRAALRSGVNVPYECNSGGCGSCKFELIDGEVEDIWQDAPGLNPRDRRKGRRLSCQCKPKTDCTIKMQTGTETLPGPKPERFSVTYVGRRDLTDDMAEFHFQSQTPAHFRSGQFALFDLPGIEGDRAYSMSNVANENGDWTFIIKQMPDGQGTHYLFHTLQDGDTLNIDGPYGHAFFREDVERDIVLIGGGSGLSPVMSIARTVVGLPQFSDRTVHLFYGGRGPQDICTPDLIQEIDPVGAKLICHNAVSDVELAQQHGWDGPCGFVHEVVEEKLNGTMPQFEYYFCGPPPMTQAVQRLTMIENQVPFDQIHFDRFF